jgi:drug/metabolite transporter (DMT)-like permease
LWSVFLIIFAAFQWGLAGGLASWLMQSGWSADVMAFWRVLIGLAAMLVWMLSRWRHITLRGTTLALLGWSALAGLGIAGNFSFYFMSIDQGSIAVAVTLMYTAPVMVFLVSFITGIERPTVLKGLVIVVVMVGIALLTGLHRAELETVTLLGLMSGLLSGVSYALFLFSFKMAGRQGSTALVLVLSLSSATVAMLPWVDLDLARQVPGSDQLWLFLLFGLLGAGLSFYCYFAGLRWALPSTAAIVAMVEPITATTFGWVILNQRLETMGIVGMAIILAAVTGLSVVRSR